MIFNEKEILVVHNSDFLKTKSQIVAKVEKKMEIVRDEITSIVNSSRVISDNNLRLLNPNISKGENYLELPFVILDHPRIFESNNIFAYRTMFWWGNFFSSTLHLQGIYLEMFREILYSNFELLAKEKLYISIGDTPWEYHYNSDNYKLFDQDDKELMLNAPFIKFSKKIELTEIDNLPYFASEFLSFLLNILIPSVEK